ncbi:phospholipid scramblase 2-like [Ornithodoros turicata]|uniref:phospholipid scramblase 2-like n=1 Tax=Ornithodoros turicata TaxID=34597 RepID=UPI003139DD47
MLAMRPVRETMKAQQERSQTQLQGGPISRGKTGIEGLKQESKVVLCFVSGPGDTRTYTGFNADYENYYKIYTYPAWMFTVQGSNNNPLFIVNKESEPCEMVQDCFSLASGSFTARMVDTKGTATMSFQRLLRLQGGLKGCFCCCLGQEMTIGIPDGRQIASISENWTIFNTSLTIYDAKGRSVLRVIGPALPSYYWGLMSPAVFKVKTVAGTVVGQITVSRVINVSFPVNLDVHIKGCLIGCAILVKCCTTTEEKWDGLSCFQTVDFSETPMTDKGCLPDVLQDNLDMRDPPDAIKH